MPKQEPIENYDNEYVINCIKPLFEFINNHGSINESRTKEARTDHSKKCEQKSVQSESRYQNNPKSSDNKTNERSQLLSTQQKVYHINAIKENEIKMDYKNIEQLEREDPTAETLALTSTWKELVKPNDYKMTNGVWKRYNPSRFLKKIKRIELELHQKLNDSFGRKWNNIVKTPQKKKADEKNCSE